MPDIGSLSRVSVPLPDENILAGLTGKQMKMDSGKTKFGTSFRAFRPDTGAAGMDYLFIFQKISSSSSPDSYNDVLCPPGLELIYIH